MGDPRVPGHEGHVGPASGTGARARRPHDQWPRRRNDGGDGSARTRRNLEADGGAGARVPR
jgi:hypothetical protein